MVLSYVFFDGDVTCNRRVSMNCIVDGVGDGIPYIKKINSANNEIVVQWIARWTCQSWLVGCGFEYQWRISDISGLWILKTDF